MSISVMVLPLGFRIKTKENAKEFLPHVSQNTDIIVADLNRNGWVYHIRLTSDGRPAISHVEAYGDPLQNVELMMTGVDAVEMVYKARRSINAYLNKMENA